MKESFGPQSWLFPMPVVLVGANCGGKPNFCTVAYVSMVAWNPPHISISILKDHHTTAGIQETGHFSINTPREDQMGVTDWLGIESGHKIDKSSVLEVFYDPETGVPLASQCPINLSCTLVKTVDLGMTDIILIGRIDRTWADSEVLVGTGETRSPKLDLVRPILFAPSENTYYGTGSLLGDAFSVGIDWRRQQEGKS